MTACGSWGSTVERIWRTRSVCLGLLGAAGLAAAPTALATTYYVDTIHGNDSSPGTSPGYAWASLARANRAVLHPGDALALHGGETFAGPLLLGAQDGGDPARLVTVTSYDGGRATIAVAHGDGVTVQQAGGFLLSNMTVTGGGAASDAGVGVHAVAAGDTGPRLDTVRLSGLDVSGFRGGGVVFEAGGLRGFTNVVVDRVSAHDNGDVGIKFAGRFVQGTEGGLPYAHTHILVSNSSAFHNHGDPGTGQNTGSGILLGQVQDGAVRFCSAWGNGGLGRNVGGGPVGIWAFDADRILIERNVSYDNLSQPAGATGADGDGFDLDGGTSNSVVQYNYARNNQGAGLLLTQFATARRFRHNLLRFNVSEDDGTGIGTYADPGTVIEDTAFDNNTVYSRRSAATVQVLPFGAYDGLAFRNNILLNVGGAPLFDSSITAGIAVQGNLYWSYAAPFLVNWGGRSYASLAEWRAGAGVEMLNQTATGQQADPLLVAAGHGGVVADPHRLATLLAYHLLPGSPAADAGLDVGRLFGTPTGAADFFGQAVTQSAPPVGAAVR